ncbi:MAG: hypothetical protein Q3971_08735 [Moraxella sp.]|nr:hypothetical protein [Moraxella sp.]
MKKLVLTLMLGICLSTHATEPNLAQCQKVLEDVMVIFAHDMSCDKHGLSSSKHIDDKTQKHAERLLGEWEGCQAVLDNFYKNASDNDPYLQALDKKLSIYNKPNEKTCQSQLPKIKSIFSKY